MNKPLPNFLPEEMQCIICCCIKPADEIDWDIFDQIGSIVCVDCSVHMDNLNKERG